MKELLVIGRGKKGRDVRDGHWFITGTPLPFPANLHIFQPSLFLLPFVPCPQTAPVLSHHCQRMRSLYKDILLESFSLGVAGCDVRLNCFDFPFFFSLSQEESQHQGRGTLQKHGETSESETTLRRRRRSPGVIGAGRAVTPTLEKRSSKQDQRNKI